jgi:hypothetical protein
MAIELPELTPDEIPTWVETPEQVQRWQLCVGITRLVAQHDDAMFASQLYNDEIPTGDLGGLV